MKRIKQTVAVVCTLGMIFSGISVQASATDLLHTASLTVSEEEFFTGPVEALSHEEISAIIAADPFAWSYSEYDVIMEEKAAAASVLALGSASAAEKEEALEILEFDPAEKVYDLQKKTDTELQNQGFDEERISIIRNFKGTEQELRALTAYCDVSATPKYTKNESGNWAKITISFIWDKAPFWNFRDALVAGANNSFLIQRVPDTSCSINYTAYGAAGSSDYLTNFTSGAMKINPFSENLVGGFSFPCAETETLANGNDITYYAASGTAVMVFKSVDDRGVGLSSGHAHAKKSVTASVGINFQTGVSAGIGFGLTDEYYHLEAEAEESYTFPA